MPENTRKMKEIEGDAEKAIARDGAAIRAVLDVMARLRDPENGCPWDKEQNFATIAPYTSLRPSTPALWRERSDGAAPQPKQDH